MLPFYDFVSRYVGCRVGVATELSVGERYNELADADVSFVCGLAYVELCGPGRLPVSPLAAPVFSGRRYGGRPVYFSDVIVRRESRFREFDDLRGATWCFNEPLSQSGYGVARHRLVELGQTGGFFGHVVGSGYHSRSICLVRSGEVDASAIDSHVLALEAREDPSLLDDLRVIDVLGPSTVQPVVAADRLPEGLRNGVRRALLGMASDPAARPWLARGMIERFAPVDDSSYDDLRRMRRACEDADFLTLR
jgi:phosphonate transport system substrate-binding protein